MSAALEHDSLRARILSYIPCLVSGLYSALKKYWMDEQMRAYGSLPCQSLHFQERLTANTQRKDRKDHPESKLKEKNLMKKEDATGGCCLLQRTVAEAPWQEFTAGPILGGCGNWEKQKSFLSVSESIRHLPKVTQLIMMGPELRPRSDWFHSPLCAEEDYGQRLSWKEKRTQVTDGQMKREHSAFHLKRP